VKRVRKTKNETLDKSLFKIFKQWRENNVPVDGKLIKEKALELAKELGYRNFKASDGWIAKFKSRYNVTFKSLSGESASVPEEIVSKWIAEELPLLLEEYDEDDIFNLDESGLFFKLIPNKTLAFKGNNCHNGKQSKERLNVLFGTNWSGTEKLDLLVIGKSKKPRCFKNVKSLPVDYAANKTAWMTSEIFVNYIRKCDEKFHAQGRKVLFLWISARVIPNKLKDSKQSKLFFSRLTALLGFSLWI
jgi:hypothetical protein